MHVGSRQHVVGQAHLELGTHGLRAECNTIDIANHIGHQSRFARVVLAQQHCGILHARTGTQCGGDFAQFDAEPAQLDLVVVAAEIIERAVGTPAGDIATAVHARTGNIRKRIGHETFGGQVGTTQIAARQLWPGDM